MKVTATKFKLEVWYKLSCLHTARRLIDPRGCTTTCPFCRDRVFILETHYVKPEHSDE